MQYELHHAKKVDLAGYLDCDGTYQEYETNMDTRKQIQFSKVLTDALLREQPSKTLWIEPIEDEKQGVPLTDFKILGVAEGADAMAMSCPAFKIQLADGRETIALPEELFPSLMRDAGCPYTEKEYGIPLDLIPKPIYERGLSAQSLLFGRATVKCRLFRLSSRTSRSSSRKSRVTGAFLQMMSRNLCIKQLPPSNRTLIRMPRKVANPFPAVERIHPDPFFLY